MRFIDIIDKIFSPKIARYQSLERKLKECCNIQISREQRTQIKKEILLFITNQKPKEAPNELFIFAYFLEKIKVLAAQVRPSEFFRILLREKLINFADFQRVSFRSLFPKRYRKVFTMVLLVIFVATLFFNFPFRIDRAEASLMTILEEVHGEVIVIREGQEIAASPSFLLKTQDIVRTGKNSKAVIRFLDQSVSRLDEETEVKISTLFINPVNKTETIVELVLNRGRLWARVINLINDFSRFQIKAENTLAVAKKKAAFNVSVSPKRKAKVAAIQNRVDLSVATDSKVVETTLIKGFSAEVKTHAISSPRIRPEQTEGKDTSWIAENLAKDELYIETVKKENQEKLKEQVKVAPGNPLYVVKELSESTTIALTVDEVQRQKKLLVTAQEKFAEAYLLLEKGEKEKADALLHEFQNQILAIAKWVKQYEAKYPVLAFDVKTKLTEVLNSYQKKLTLILPSAPFYRLKELVGETQLLITQDPGKKTQEKLSQAEDKLFEAHDLAEKGNTLGAQAQVQAYTRAMSDVVSEIKQLPEGAKEKAMAAILDTKLDTVKTLQALVVVPSVSSLPGSSTSSTTLLPPPSFAFGTSGSSTAMGTSAFLGSTTAAGTLPLGTSVPVGVTVKPFATELQKTVSAAKTEALTKLGEAMLEIQKNQPSVEVLKKLQDIKTIDVNGKSLVDVQLSRDRVTIQSEGRVIAVPSSPQIVNSGSLELPPVQP